MFSGLLIQKYEIYKFGVGIGNKIATALKLEATL